MPNDRHVLRPKEAALYVGTRSTLERLAREGELEFIVVGNERRFFLGSLLDWQDRNRGDVRPFAGYREYTTADCKAAALGRDSKSATRLPPGFNGELTTADHKAALLACK